MSPTAWAFVGTCLIVAGLALVAPGEVATGGLVIAVFGWIGYWVGHHTRP